MEAKSIFKNPNLDSALLRRDFGKEFHAGADIIADDDGFVIIPKKDIRTLKVMEFAEKYGCYISMIKNMEDNGLGNKAFVMRRKENK